ncbi:hypothetical protein [Aquimarina sp. SS2-1]|uniref:hypothetical protein n=1 Tax=Aquimarina besae TaxID=3342247 RepID=UPI00366AE151
MNYSCFRHKLLLLTSFITIGIFGQEKVTEQSSFSNQESFKNVIPVTSPNSKMPIHNPNYTLDTQINQTLINDTDPKIMPIYKPYLSLNPKTTSSLTTVRLKSIEEIMKDIKNNSKP